jgi:hypothetical protein
VASSRSNSPPVNPEAPSTAVPTFSAIVHEYAEDG